MDVSDYLREPAGASVAAALITTVYIYCKSKMNNETVPPTSAYIKPAILNAIMVYFIISSGANTKQRISTDPF